MGNAVPNIITDWALLILPIPYIWRLQQSRPQKIALCGVFLLGGLYVAILPLPLGLRVRSAANSLSICIISIVRLCVMSTQLFGTPSTDYTWLLKDSSTWTAVETNIAIVSGVSIPAICFVSLSS